jgi:hypothetical protein
MMDSWSESAGPQLMNEHEREQKSPTSIIRLFRGRLFIFLGCESETLGFFAAGRAFLYVISALAISHKT